MLIKAVSSVEGVREPFRPLATFSGGTEGIGGRPRNAATPRPAVVMCLVNIFGASVGCRVSEPRPPLARVVPLIYGPTDVIWIKHYYALKAFRIAVAVLLPSCCLLGLPDVPAGYLPPPTWNSIYTGFMARFGKVFFGYVYALVCTRDVLEELLEIDSSVYYFRFSNLFYFFGPKLFDLLPFRQP